MSSKKTEDLHPLFQGMVSELIHLSNKEIASTGYTFFITDGYRSIDEQNELYSHGRNGDSRPIVTNARGGQSAHNYGLAVDCAFQKSGKLDYSGSLYAKVYPIARRLGFVLGSDWKSFPDKPHFEYPNWEKIKGGSMNMFMGYDLDNAESMKEAVKILVRVQQGEFVDKSKYLTDVENAKKSGYDNGFIDGKLHASSQPSTVDLTKWTENGMLVEKTVGDTKITINYKLK